MIIYLYKRTLYHSGQFITSANEEAVVQPSKDIALGLNKIVALTAPIQRRDSI